jgi:DNA invertase Pin-like site-specific DNA recombinase
MNIISYLRVSTEDQNLTPQRIEIGSYVERFPGGPHSVVEFSDVISGSKAKRPGLAALEARCAQGGVDLVMVVKLDRLGRSLIDVVALIKRLEKCGVPVICTSQGIDTRASNPCGKFTIAVMAACAELERDMLIERTKAGLVAARARGKVLGRPSPVLEDEASRNQTIRAWMEGGKKNGYRGLAEMLGGCSPMTARRLFLISIKQSLEPFTSMELW